MKKILLIHPIKNLDRLTEYQIDHCKKLLQKCGQKVLSLLPQNNGTEISINNQVKVMSADEILIWAHLDFKDAYLEKLPFWRIIKERNLERKIFYYEPISYRYIKVVKSAMLICSIRNAKSESIEENRKYVYELESRGWWVHWPYRDTVQNKDLIGNEICFTNCAAQYFSDEVHINYDSNSTGSCFDYGAVALLNALEYTKKIKVIGAIKDPKLLFRSFEINRQLNADLQKKYGQDKYLNPDYIIPPLYIYMDRKANLNDLIKAKSYQLWYDERIKDMFFYLGAVFMLMSVLPKIAPDCKKEERVFQIINHDLTKATPGKSYLNLSRWLQENYGEKIGKGNKNAKNLKTKSSSKVNLLK